MEDFWLAGYVLLWVLVLFLLFAVFLVFRQIGVMYLGTSAGIGRDGPPLGARAPDLKALDLTRKELAVPHTNGRWLFLVFGRPVCPPCQALIPHLNSAAKERANDTDFVFVCQSDVELASIFANEAGVRVPVVAVPPDEVARLYGIRASPFAVVVDSEKVVHGKGLVSAREHMDDLLQRAHENADRHKSHEPTGLVEFGTTSAEGR